jgi:hypothetical protein
MSTSGNLYPFTTKAQIKNRLDNDQAYRIQAMAILHTLQTEHEQATKSTLNKNRQGFMSSHAVKGSTVAMKIKAGEPLTDEDLVVVDTIAPRYSRQLATFARAQEIAQNPALAKTAEMFSANRNLPAVVVADEAPESEVVEADEEAPASEPGDSEETGDSF